MTRTHLENVYHGRIARLLVMPEDGIVPVRALIDGARQSLTIKMFEFDSAELIAALVAAKDRGVAVEVLLNPVRSSGLRPNDGTLAALRAAGIEAGWTSPHFVITHEKSMVVDGRIAMIATFNLSGKYFTHTRDYGLVIEDPVIVEEVSACFAADRAHAPFALRAGSPLAWGNQNARHAIADFVDAAEKTLLIHNPKFHDASILDHVLAARARGVNVHFLCGGRHGIEDRDLLATFSFQRILARAGVHVRKQHHLKLHAKMLLADGNRAILGSMNIDRDAYDLRRELGIAFDDPETVARLNARFEADWHEAKSYEAPDPLQIDLHTAVDAEALTAPETALLHD